MTHNCKEPFVFSMNKTCVASRDFETYFLIKDVIRPIVLQHIVLTWFDYINSQIKWSRDSWNFNKILLNQDWIPLLNYEKSCENDYIDEK